MTVFSFCLYNYAYLDLIVVKWNFVFTIESNKKKERGKKKIRTKKKEEKNATYDG